MWKPENRGLYDHRSARYPSDLSDAEWELIRDVIPPAKRGGRRRTVDVREVLNAIFYQLWTGCQWRGLPKEFPPRSTVHDYFRLWQWDGTLARLHDELYVRARELAGREPSPSCAVIDSQSVSAPAPPNIACGVGRDWPAPTSLQQSPRDSRRIGPTEVPSVAGASRCSAHHHIKLQRQVAFDAKHKLIVEQHVTPAGSDLSLLAQTAGTAKEVLGVERATTRA